MLLFPVVGKVPLKGKINNNGSSHTYKALSILLDKLEEFLFCKAIRSWFFPFLLKTGKH